MGEVILFATLSFCAIMLYRVFLLFYTTKNPQIVEIDSYFYLRKLDAPFTWKYSKNKEDAWGDIVFIGETALAKEDRDFQIRHYGFSTIDKARTFKDVHFVNKNKKFKAKRVDGLFVLCKNTISKLIKRKKD